MGVALGVLPSNLTTPLRVELGGPPAFTAGCLDMQIIRVKVAIRVRLFVVIRTNFLPWRLGLDFFFFQIKITKPGQDRCHSKVTVQSFWC
jgi:hypothetical protein